MSPLGAGDPSRVGPYELQGRLGEGGMGAVYLGRKADGPLVAIKVVRGDLAGDPHFLARFRDEVRSAERVASFCTAQVLDHGEDDGRAYMVTEYIDGPSLLTYVSERGALSPGMLHGVAAGVAAALVAIHAAGLVHRDLKPGNVLLSISGPRVIDFGIARALDDTSRHTRTGQVIGSAGWIAPEMILNRPITPAADVFAWGCLVAFAGSGVNPFGRGTFQVLAARVVHAEPDLGPLPEPLAGLVRRALDKDPARRPTAQDLLLSLVGGGGEAAVGSSLGAAWPGAPAPGTGAAGASAVSGAAMPGVPAPSGTGAAASEAGAPGAAVPQAGAPDAPASSGTGPGVGEAEATALPVGAGWEAGTAPSGAPGAGTHPGRPLPGVPGARRRLLPVAAVVGLLAAVAGGGAAYALRSASGNPPVARGTATPIPAAEGVPEESAKTVPATPMLVRIDAGPGWPEVCDARIGLLAPRDGGISAPRPIVAGEGCDFMPSWSLDRRQIAFLRSLDGGPPELWVAGADGRGARRLVTDVLRRSRPVFAPDGESVAYLREAGGVAEIFITGLRGGTRQVTRDGRDKSDLTWSPDGKLGFFGGTGAERQIYYIRPDVPGDSWHQVTTRQMAPRGADDPHWSPDGRRMLFTVKASDGNDGDQNIGVVDADGRNFRLLTTGPANEHDPTWSPGGRWIAYVRGLSPTLQVWAMPVGDESRARRISPDHVGQAAWH